MLDLLDKNGKFAGLSDEQRNKINQLLNLYNSFEEKTDKQFDSFVRFCDYYDMGISVMQNIEYFKSYYNDETLLIYFIKYIVDKVAEDLFFVLSEEEFGINELLEIIDEKNILDELIDAIEYALNLLVNFERDDVELEFLNESNPYKIMFTKMANEDIRKIPKNIVLSFIRKLYFPLSVETVIRLSESLGHTNDLYGTSYARIHFAADYRITYYRERNITVILGVIRKHGNNADYTRYDSFAKNHDDLLCEINDFIDGNYTEDHHAAIEFLKDVSRKRQKN